MTLELLITKLDFDKSSIKSSTFFRDDFNSLRSSVSKVSHSRSRDDSSLIRTIASDFISSYFAISDNLLSNKLAQSTNLRNPSLVLSSAYVLDKYFSQNNHSNFVIDSSFSSRTFADINYLSSRYPSPKQEKQFLYSVIKDIEKSHFSNKRLFSSSLEFADNYFQSMFSNFYKNLNEGDGVNSILDSNIIVDGFSYSPKNVFERLPSNKSYLVNELKNKKELEKKVFSKQNELRQKTEDKFDLDLYTITLSEKDEVTYDEVQGNEESKDFLTRAVKDLMLYNSKTNINPLLELGSINNLALLAGDAGTGKTFTSNYAISLAQNIADKHNLDFEAVKLSIDSSYQDGSVLMLKNQLNKISQSKKTHIIFLDDCEKFFPDRQTSKLEYKKDNVAEFLHFTQGLNGYKMKGNYLLIATANLPESLDKAILSRFGDAVFHCEGPTTPEQKANVLKNNLSEGIKNGFVNINDWSIIGQYAHEYNLKGRDLSSIAKTLLGDSRSNTDYDVLYENISYPEKVLDLLRNSYEPITEKDVLKRIELMGSVGSKISKAQDSYRK